MFCLPLSCRGLLEAKWLLALLTGADHRRCMSSEQLVGDFPQPSTSHGKFIGKRRPHPQSAGLSVSAFSPMHEQPGTLRHVCALSKVREQPGKLHGKWAFKWQPWGECWARLSLHPSTSHGKRRPGCVKFAVKAFLPMRAQPGTFQSHGKWRHHPWSAGVIIYVA